MNTLGSTTKRVCKKEESWSINDGFVAKVAMPAYTVVKLDPATGEVEPIAAAGDKPFGILSVGAKEAGDTCTVQTPFCAIVRGNASGALVIGDDVTALAPADVSGETLGKYIKAVAATGYVCGVALTDAADGEDVWIGIHRVFTQA